MEMTSAGDGIHHFDSVELLRRQILQVLAVKNLSVPTGSCLVDPDVQSVLFSTVFAKPCPSGTQGYRYRILKKVLGLISDACINPEEDQISDDLASCLGSLLEANFSENVVQSYMTQMTCIQYVSPQPLSTLASNSITINEATNIYSGGGTTGHRTWEAALHLAYFLSSPSSPVKPSAKVLELGAGRGLVSHVCADVCQARMVIPTDGTESLVDSLKSHVPEGSSVWSPQILDWELNDGAGSLSDLPETAKTDLDVVLGADITFDSRILLALSKTIAELLRQNLKARAIIAATVRNKATLQQFEVTCNEQGLTIHELTVVCPNEVKDQTGFFHSHEVPIVIYDISRMARIRT